MSDLTAVSLFAGIGGIDLALERVGVRVVAAVEIDPACREVLRRHFPKVQLFDDVTEVTGDQLRAAGFVPGRGLVAAGWPCQGNSVAGRGGGLGDSRSGLWRHVVRLLAEARPRWFLGENVPGLLSVNDGRDFGAVLRDLDDLGYGVAWRVLDAQWLGVPQRRRRVFLAGCLGDPCGPVQVLLEPEGGAGHLAARGAAGTDIAGTLGSRAGGSRTTDLDGHGAYVIGALGTTGPGGGWRVGADEAAAGQLVASTLQGGGRRGHRIDAEGAAGGHLVAIAFDAAQITSGENRANPQPGDPTPTLAAQGQPMLAYPLDLRNAARSTEAGETAGTGIGEDGDPCFTISATGRALPGVATFGGEGVTHALTAEGADASEDGTGRGTPIVAVPMAFNPQTGGSRGRLGSWSQADRVAGEPGHGNPRRCCGPPADATGVRETPGSSR